MKGGSVKLWLGAQCARSECYSGGMGIVYCGVDVVSELSADFSMQLSASSGVVRIQLQDWAEVG